MIVSAKRVRELKSAAELAVRGMTSNYLVLCKLLWEIKEATFKVGRGDEKPLWLIWGFDTWENFIEHGLKMHYGRANRLVLVWQKLFVECECNERHHIFLEIGITNLLEIAKVVTPKNANRWLSKAKRMSCCELRHEVLREQYGRMGRKMPLRTFARVVPAKGMSKLRRAMRLAQDLYELETPGEALVTIAEEFERRHAHKRLKAA